MISRHFALLRLVVIVAGHLLVAASMAGQTWCPPHNTSGGARKAYGATYCTYSAWSPAWDESAHYTDETCDQSRTKTEQKPYDMYLVCSKCSSAWQKAGSSTDTGSSSSEQRTVRGTKIRAVHTHAWETYEASVKTAYGEWSAWSPEWNSASHLTTESVEQSRTRTRSVTHDMRRRCTAAGHAGGDEDAADSVESGTERESRKISGTMQPQTPTHSHSWSTYNAGTSTSYGAWSEWNPTWEPASHFTTEYCQQTRTRSKTATDDLWQRCAASGHTGGDANIADRTETTTDSETRTIWGSIQPGNPGGPPAGSGGGTLYRQDLAGSSAPYSDGPYIWVTTVTNPSGSGMIQTVTIKYQYRTSTSDTFANHSPVVAGTWTLKPGDGICLYRGTTLGQNTYTEFQEVSSAPLPPRNAPPAVRIAASEATIYVAGTVGRSTSSTITFSASDPDGDLKRWRFYRSDNSSPRWLTFESATASAGPDSYTFSSGLPTKITFYVEAEDMAGNTNSDSVIVNVGQEPTPGCTITVTAVPAEGGSTSGTRVQVDGSADAPVSAQANAGWYFVGWGGGDSASVASIVLEPNPSFPSSSTAVVHMDGKPRHVTANFSRLAVSVASAVATYDGTPRVVSWITNPAGLAVLLTYNGSTTPPSDVGVYRVVATVTTPGLTASGEGTLTITPKPVSFTFSPTSFLYDGTEHGPAIGNPDGATYAVSGAQRASAAGSYRLSVTANGNYTGSSVCDWEIRDLRSQTVSITPSRASLIAGASVSFVASGGSNGYVWGGEGAGSGATRSVSFAIPGSYQVTVYSPGGNGYRSSNTATAQVDVGAAPQNVAITPPLALITPGQSVTLSASGGMNGYIWGGSAAGDGSAKTLSFGQPGTYGVTVQSPAGGSFAASNVAVAQVTVAHAQTITFPPPGSFLLRSGGTHLAASASSGLPVRFSVLSGPGTLSGASYISFGGLGAIVVQADQDGDSNFMPAPSVRQTVVVNNPPATALGFSGPTGLILERHQDTNQVLPTQP